MRVRLLESMIIFTDKDLLQERRERVNQSECLATIAICRTTTQSVTSVFLIKPEPYPRDQPAKLDDDKWTLKADYAHDSRECEVRHRECL